MGPGLHAKQRYALHRARDTWNHQLETQFNRRALAQ